MRLPQALAVAFTLLATSCSENAEVRPALEVFKHFQTALFQGDRDALRHMVTRESKQVVPHLPLAAVAGKKPVQVLRAARSGYRVHIEVSDPNEGGAHGWFVVAKENGKWVVDLVETTSFNHTIVDTGDQILVPRRLSPDEIERIRSLDTSTIR